jgi:hypothetical protein
MLGWRPSRGSSEVPLSADLKVKLGNVDEHQVLIDKYPLAIKLPILLRLWGIAHLRSRSHQLTHNQKDFRVPIGRRDRNARMALLYCCIDDFGWSQSRIRGNDLRCLSFLLRGPFGFMARMNVKSQDASFVENNP